MPRRLYYAWTLWHGGRAMSGHYDTEIVLCVDTMTRILCYAWTLWHGGSTMRGHYNTEVMNGMQMMRQMRARSDRPHVYTVIASEQTTSVDDIVCVCITRLWPGRVRVWHYSVLDSGSSATHIWHTCWHIEYQCCVCNYVCTSCVNVHVLWNIQDLVHVYHLIHIRSADEHLLQVPLSKPSKASNQV